MLVFDLTDQVRETIQQTLYPLLMQRRRCSSDSDARQRSRWYQRPRFAGSDRRQSAGC